MQETLAETAGNLAHLIEREAEKAPDQEPQLSGEPNAEIVGDKGYHSNDTVLKVQQAPAQRIVISSKRDTLHVFPVVPVSSPTISYNRHAFCKREDPKELNLMLEAAVVSQTD